MKNLFSKSILTRLFAAGLSLTGMNSSARAQVIFTDRTNFQAASLTLTTESFGALIPSFPSTSGVFGAWDSSGIGSPGNLAGTIAPGLQISIEGGDGIFLGLGRVSDFSSFVGGATDAFVFSNQNVDGVKLVFNFANGGTTAVGFDYFNPGTNGNFVSAIQVFDRNGALLASVSPTSTATGAFFGITSTTAIGRITMQNFAPGPGSENVEVADNISFGAAIPEPSTLALLGLGALTLGLATRKRR